jgi:hypothetical protein
VNKVADVSLGDAEVLRKDNLFDAAFLQPIADEMLTNAPSAPPHVLHDINAPVKCTSTIGDSDTSAPRIVANP